MGQLMITQGRCLQGSLLRFDFSSSKFEVRSSTCQRFYNTAADALSRRPRHPDDTNEDLEADEDKDDEWILSELGEYGIYPVEVEEDDDIDNDSDVPVVHDPELIQRNQILQDMKSRVQRLRE